MRVGAREGFAHHSVKLVLLANGDRYEDDSNTFYQSGKALHLFEILPCPNSDFFSTHIRICSLCAQRTARSILRRCLRELSDLIA